MINYIETYPLNTKKKESVVDEPVRIFKFSHQTFDRSRASP